MQTTDPTAAVCPDTVTIPPAPTDIAGAFALLTPQIQLAIKTAGYTTPTPIQEQCIPHLLEGRDLLGSAQTGTGKTAAFCLPLLQRLDASPRRAKRGTPRALILAPTRELAAQIADSLYNYGRNMRVSHTVVFGGVSQHTQVKALNRGVDVLVATPGRLLDLMQQGHIHLHEVEVFILDEVDRMLDMGFIHDIKRVLKTIPEQRQTLFFSATMAPKMEQLAFTMVRNPVRITIAPDKPTVDAIEQSVMFVGKKNKDSLLRYLIDDQDIQKVIVFTQMKHMANRVVKKLEAAGIESSAIHGNKSQSARLKALDGFKKGRFKVLVATDVAARGIDIDDIGAVIHYQPAKDVKDYLHRSGRTARAGRDGWAVTLVEYNQHTQVRILQRGMRLPNEKAIEVFSNDVRLLDLSEFEVD
jgi:ATP-dependent RNA helicase RhlE